MKLRAHESWLYPATLKDAKIAQEEMASHVRLENDFSSLKSIGGMDVSHNIADPEERIFGVAITLDKETLEIQEENSATLRQEFPYIPGFLGFREAPVLVEAFSRLIRKPDLMIIDGHGIAHPRGLGIASQIGVLLDIPTIGVAKNILVGKTKKPLGEAAGSVEALYYKEKVMGYLARTKSKTLPLVISPGHRVSLETAKEIVFTFVKKHKLPEPTRKAHAFANQVRVKYYSK